MVRRSFPRRDHRRRELGRAVGWWPLAAPTVLLLSACGRSDGAGAAGAGPAPPSPPPSTVASAEPEPPEPDEPREDGSELVPSDASSRAQFVARPDAPNMRYAKLDSASCAAELQRRAIPFERAPATRGVATPVWLRGPLHGVAIHSALSPRTRLRSSVEIFDCRLVLAMDDFAAQLAAHDVVEIVHMSAYRPAASRGCTPKYKGKQHCAALAVDVGSFKKKDGTMLVVERDFNGKIGLATCSESASPKPPSPAADELWSFVCDAARKATFHVMLTPNYNRQHHNHFHLEITPGVTWMLVQ